MPSTRKTTEREPTPRERLIWGACFGKVRAITAAVRDGANPNTMFRGRTALIWAVQEHQLAAVKALVRTGASLERKDALGFSALGDAAGSGDYEIAEFLLKAGAKVDARTQGGTALHTACAYSRTAIVKLLLDHGADPQARDKEGRRPSFFIRKGAEQTKQRLRKLLKEATDRGNKPTAVAARPFPSLNGI